MKKILLAPLDPVHDNAVKLIKRKLKDYDYQTILMPPGTTVEEVIHTAIEEKPSAILVSRTLGYQVAETLSRLVDLAEAAGIRQTARLGVGGMAITREIGAELGFDATFVGELKMTELLSFLENRKIEFLDGDTAGTENQQKPDITAGYTYQFKDSEIESLLDSIAGQALHWASTRSSDGIKRAQLREEMLTAQSDTHLAQLRGDYTKLSGSNIRSFYTQGILPSGVRWLESREVENLPRLLDAKAQKRSLRHTQSKPLFFVQYGTGCPVMDIVHIRACEAWGTDGVLHFDPSWNAQQEGLLEGLLSHEHDGTILTLENLKLIRQYISPNTLWDVRGHRGLNTAETQVLGHAAGADLFKINIPYGSTGGGTDPARLAVDGIYSLHLAAQYSIPFDIPGNDELSGVPPHKTFAGILIMMAIGLKFGARPIPKPLMCYSPYMAMHGDMDDNMVDMNTAKLAVWQTILDTPVWPGEPIGFMTHSPERVQSATTTAAHAALAASLGVDAATIASTDEAYSKGPISLQARVDTLRSVRDLLRFTGSAHFQATPQADIFMQELREGILTTLKQIASRGDFVQSIYQGDLGSPEDGIYPGRVGQGTVYEI
jgi:methylmalonyl-CoA mutase cobalamin-binding subunit